MLLVVAFPTAFLSDGFSWFGYGISKCSISAGHLLSLSKFCKLIEASCRDIKSIAIQILVCFTCSVELCNIDVRCYELHRLYKDLYVVNLEIEKPELLI